MVKLSIIIPFYETYELTEKLLDVLTPQYTNEVEIIIIDDSNDLRLDKYSKSCTIIHNKEKTDVSYARNKGVDISSGKYIAFIDSDDMVSKDYIETLIKAINEHVEDIVYFDWQDMNTKEINHKPQNYAVWKAIYKKSILPRFNDKMRFNEDVDFQAKISNTPHISCYIDKVLYFYNSNREGSLTLEKEKIRRINMIRCEVIENFTLRDFDKLENIQRKRHNEYGKLFVGDTFICSQEMADYLTGENPVKKVVVKVVEVAKNELTEKEAKLVEDLEKAKDIIEKPKKTKSSKRKAM